MSYAHIQSRYPLGPTRLPIRPENGQPEHSVSELRERWTSFPWGSIAVRYAATLKGDTVWSRSNHPAPRHPDLHHSCDSRCSTPFNLKWEEYHQNGEWKTPEEKQGTRKWETGASHIFVCTWSGQGIKPGCWSLGLIWEFRRSKLLRFHSILSLRFRYFAKLCNYLIQHHTPLIVFSMEMAPCCLGLMVYECLHHNLIAVYYTVDVYRSPLSSSYW